MNCHVTFSSIIDEHTRISSKLIQEASDWNLEELPLSLQLKGSYRLVRAKYSCILKGGLLRVRITSETLK